VGPIHPIPWQQMVVGKPSEQIMNNVVRTTFAGKNPFKPQYVPIDLNTIRVTSDKPKSRKPTYSRYENLFSQLEVGKSLSCLPKDCVKIGQALRDYVRRNGLNWTVKVQSNYNKTTGRVFVLEKK
jgi:hypothetical protein